MRIGAYGKIPDAGDFLRIDTPRGFVAPWDEWLQMLLTTARAALGQGFDAAYLSAPIWRFGLAADLAGPLPVMGVMMPSVDRVGRRFPLTLTVGLPERCDPIASVNTHAPLLAALEEIALATLDDGATRTDFEAALVDLGRQTSLPRALSATAVTGTFRNPTIWQAQTPGTARYTVIEGLPGPRLMPSLIDPQALVWNAEGAR